MRILFVTWDGPQLGYVESLFLPIFQGLQQHGYHSDILQFRWGDEVLAEPLRQLCHNAGVGYRAVPISRRFGGIGPLMSAVAGARQVRAAVKAFGSDIVMPRSLMPAIAVLAAGGDRFRPILFDADGLQADERVEFAGLSRGSMTYRLLRQVEQATVLKADAILVRTPMARDVLVKRTGGRVPPERFHVVRNGRDADLFSPRTSAERRAVRAELAMSGDAPLLVYAGSVGDQYRFDLMASTFAAIRARRADARLLVLSGSTEEARARFLSIQPELKEYATFLRARPLDVPRYLAAADAGLACRATSFSMRAVAPIKLSEYLLCGLPVLGTGAIGDTAPAVRAGVFVDPEDGVESAACWFTEQVLTNRETYRSAAREVGVEFFSLRRSIDDYRAALQLMDRFGQAGGGLS